MAQNYFQYCDGYSFRNIEETLKFQEIYSHLTKLKEFYDDDNVISLEDLEGLDRSEGDLESFKKAFDFFFSNDRKVLTIEKVYEYFQNSADLGEVEDTEAIVYFSDNEGGNLDLVCDFMQEFLIYSNSDSYFSMSWSESCSKHRVGEFGGGAVVVTKEEQKVVSSFLFLNRKSGKHKREQYLKKLIPSKCSFSPEEYALWIQYLSLNEPNILESLVRLSRRKNNIGTLIQFLKNENKRVREQIDGRKIAINNIYLNLLNEEKNEDPVSG